MHTFYNKAKGLVCYLYSIRKESVCLVNIMKKIGLKKKKTLFHSVNYSKDGLSAHRSFILFVSKLEVLLYWDKRIFTFSEENACFSFDSLKTGKAFIHHHFVLQNFGFCRVLTKLFDGFDMMRFLKITQFQ